MLQPLWFVGVYLLVTALTRLVLAADRRLGLLALVPDVLVAATVWPQSW